MIWFNRPGGVVASTLASHTEDQGGGPTQFISTFTHKFPKLSLIPLDLNWVKLSFTEFFQCLNSKIIILFEDIQHILWTSFHLVLVHIKFLTMALILF